MSRLVGVGAMALTVFASACASSGSSHPPRTSTDAVVASHPASGLVTKTWPTGTGNVPLRLNVPAEWRVTPFDGTPAPTFFPLVYLSRAALPTDCPDQPATPTSRNGSTKCFNGNWPVTDNGFVIRWGESENPTASPFNFAVGRHATLSGHQARIYDGVATSECVANGGATEIDATILRASSGYETFVMHACLGPRALPPDREAIKRMLMTLEIN